MVALASTFMMGGLTAQHNALLRRQMRFGSIASIDILTTLVGIIIGITTAWLGFSYWALVAMTMGSSITNCIAVWVASPWRPGRIYRGAGVLKMVKFGSCLSISQVSNFISGNCDKLIIGHNLGPGPLGIYNRAFQLLLMPMDQLYGPVSSVFLATLSRLAGEPDKYRKAVRQIGDLLVMAITPLAAVSIVLSSEIVSIFLGDAWAEAASTFRTLAVVALVLPINYLGAIILQSSGRTDVMMKWAPVSMIISITSIFIGVPWGLIGIATAWAIGVITIRTPLFYLIISRSTKVSFFDVCYPVLFYSIPFLLLLAGGIGIRNILHSTSPVVNLLFISASLTACYSAFLYLTGKHRIIGKLARYGTKQ